MVNCYQKHHFWLLVLKNCIKLHYVFCLLAYYGGGGETIQGMRHHRGVKIKDESITLPPSRVHFSLLTATLLAALLPGCCGHSFGASCQLSCFCSFTVQHCTLRTGSCCVRFTWAFSSCWKQHRDSLRWHTESTLVAVHNVTTRILHCRHACATRRSGLLTAREKGQKAERYRTAFFEHWHYKSRTHFTRH